MADDPTTLTDAPVRSEGVPPVLDEAHIGDIRGALGTISMHDTGERHGWRSRSMALLAIMGPGLIVMVGDNDAGGVSTYSQAGQNFGTTLLWVLVLLIPVLIVNQEMVIRLGAVTGVGHARLINERFGRFWGWFSVGRPVRPELPDDRHRVHRREPRAGVFRRQLIRGRPLRGGHADRDYLDRQLSQLGAVHVRVRDRQLPGDPAADPGPPALRPDRPGHARAEHPRRCRLHGGAADHRDRRHDGRAVAAVLSAVEHHRQADHAALDQLRAR